MELANRFRHLAKVMEVGPCYCISAKVGDSCKSSWLRIFIQVDALEYSWVAVKELEVCYHEGSTVYIRMNRVLPEAGLHSWVPSRIVDFTSSDDNDPAGQAEHGGEHRRASGLTCNVCVGQESYYTDFG